MARLVLAIIAVGLLCRFSAVDAACCTSGQPTGRGSELNIPGVPTCTDGPCSGEGFDYLPTGAAESPDPMSCCDTSKGSGFSYNPKAGSEAKWPSFEKFPMYFDGTGGTCDPEKPVYRCTISGKTVAGSQLSIGDQSNDKERTRKFNLRHLLA